MSLHSKVFVSISRFCQVLALLSAASGMLLADLPARADALPVLLLPGQTISSIPQFNDNLQTGLIDQEYLNFGGIGTPNGSLLDFITKSSINPFGSQNLVFGYLITVGSGNVVGLSVSGFNGFQTAVKVADLGGPYALPTSVSRSADGNTISYAFAGILGGPVPPLGSVNFTALNTSETLAIYTDAPNFVDPASYVVDASGARASVQTLGPASAVPEPSTLSFLAIAIVGVCGTKVWSREISRSA